MNGIRHARLNAGMTQRELTDMTGVSISLVEHDGCEPINTKVYLCLSLALHVPIDDLLKTYPEDDDLHIFSALVGKEGNLVYNYVKSRRLTCRELGKRMGVSYELARQLCSRDPASKYIENLAQYEGISAEEFYKKYGEMSEDKTINDL